MSLNSDVYPARPKGMTKTGIMCQKIIKGESVCCYAVKGCMCTRKGDTSAQALKKAKDAAIGKANRAGLLC